MGKLGTVKYHILRVLIGTISLLPWFVTDTLAYVLYLLVLLLRYRSKVIKRNLKQSFPTKTRQEINRIHKDFYRYFVYQLVSVPKLLSQSPEKIVSKHFVVNNAYLFRDLYQKGHKVIFIMMGHYGNWELFSAGNIYLAQMGYQLKSIYSPLKDKAIDRIMCELRQKLGSICIPKDDAGRSIVSSIRDKNTEVGSAFGFIADQSPSFQNVHYITKFLGQDTAFLTGAERLATKFDVPVVYMDIQYIKKAEYLCDMKLLTEKPSAMAPMQLTEMYARAMETTILRAPEHWLWSHKRWKLDLDNPRYQDCPRSNLDR